MRQRATQRSAGRGGAGVYIRGTSAKGGRCCGAGESESEKQGCRSRVFETCRARQRIKCALMRRVENPEEVSIFAQLEIATARSPYGTIVNSHEERVKAEEQIARV